MRIEIIEQRGSEDFESFESRVNESLTIYEVECESEILSLEFIQQNSLMWAIIKYN